MRPLLDLFEYQESNGGLRIDKWASVENQVFDVSIIVMIRVKLQQLDIWSFVLETKHIPGLVMMSRI